LGEVDLRKNDLLFFQEGIRPVWEDKTNGGEFAIRLYNLTRDEILPVWEDVLMFLVGSISNLYKEVNGTILSQRGPVTEIFIWVSKKLTASDFKNSL